ncbi:MAG TPA: hypothetical protein VJK71_00685, partial [Gemmatimonadales bacterium]|nr:hypothetical protein [Gemmatimonadales bacterium]
MRLPIRFRNRPDSPARCCAVFLALAAIGCRPEVVLSWQEASGYRWRELQVSGTKPGFTQLPGSRTGIQ